MVALKRRYRYRKIVSGAPRSMKMGNIVSPWRCDVVASHTLPSPMPRSAPILHEATWRNGRWLGGLRLVYSLNAIEKLAQIALGDLNVIVVLQIEP